jgi:hypothetical protein
MNLIKFLRQRDREGWREGREEEREHMGKRERGR